MRLSVPSIEAIVFDEKMKVPVSERFRRTMGAASIVPISGFVLNRAKNHGQFSAALEALSLCRYYRS